jgi:hypothetical protein
VPGSYRASWPASHSLTHVDAGERRRFEGHLRRQLKVALDAAGIEMPNRQVDVWLLGETAAA